MIKTSVIINVTINSNIAKHYVMRTFISQWDYVTNITELEMGIYFTNFAER